MKYATVDPGESTGYSVWDGSQLLSAGTAELDDFVHALGLALGVEAPGTWEHDLELMGRLRGIRELVVEDWAIYPWKAERGDLNWDKCRTARGIGALEYICQSAGLPYKLQPAAIKDQAVAAGAEEFFLRPLHDNRHANDAIMHGVFRRVVTGIPEAAAS